MVCGWFRSKETFSDLDPNPQFNFVYFTDQNQILIGKKVFSLKVLLLYTIRKYIKSEAKFKKTPYAENKVVASYECVKISEIRMEKFD